jgi:hypothetical protein
MFGDPFLPKTEFARIGALNTVRIASGNAFTHVAAYPTTRAELVLYNNEPTGGACYIIDSVWHLSITSMAAVGSVAIIAQIVASPAAPTDNTSQLITSNRGTTYAGRALRAIAQTTAIANKWELLASSNNGGSATAQIGLASFAECWGKFVIRPGDMFAVNVVAGTAAGTAIMGITWAESPCLI